MATQQRVLQGRVYRNRGPAAETESLHSSSRQDPLRYYLSRLSPSAFQLPKSHCRYLHVQVDAVEQRARDPVPVALDLVGGAPDNEPAFSPDGRWLAYTSNETGRREVYVRPFSDGGAKVQVSTDGGTEPTWHPTGREIFFRAAASPSYRFLAVPIRTEPQLSAGNPRPLFETDFTINSEWAFHSYQLSPDGERFLMARPIEEAQETPRLVYVPTGSRS